MVTVWLGFAVERTHVVGETVAAAGFELLIATVWPVTPELPSSVEVDLEGASDDHGLAGERERQRSGARRRGHRHAGGGGGEPGAEAVTVADPSASPFTWIVQELIAPAASERWQLVERGTATVVRAGRDGHRDAGGIGVAAQGEDERGSAPARHRVARLVERQAAAGPAGRLGAVRQGERPDEKDEGLRKSRHGDRLRRSWWKPHAPLARAGVEAGLRGATQRTDRQMHPKWSGYPEGDELGGLLGAIAAQSS